jgi:hypothetical protein
MAASKGNKHAVGNKGGGRKTSYKPEYVKIAAQLCLLGATDKNIADALGVCETTINGWKNKHVEFSEALKEGKAETDAKVEHSLYERAMGYSCPEEKVFCIQGEVITHQSRKHYPPETTACIFWLKNRRADEWRDQRNVDINILTDEERVQRINALVRGVLDREVTELTKH